MNRHQAERGFNLGGCLIAAFVVVLILGGLGYFGFRKAMDKAGELVAGQLRENPVIVEHIGEIDEVDMDLAETGKAQLGKDWAVWSITGSKGSGLLKLHIPTGDKEEPAFQIKAGELQMEDGESYDLYPDDPPASDEKTPDEKQPEKTEPEPAPAKKK